MFDALQWVEQICSDLKPLEKQILGHSYFKALEEGRLQRDQLKVFALQQHQIIISDLRSIALIVSRQGLLPSRRFLMNVLQGEAAALDALHAFADALGLDVSDLEVLEPLPGAHAYCGFGRLAGALRLRCGACRRVPDQFPCLGSQLRADAQGTP
jgi:thiaminase